MSDLDHPPWLKAMQYGALAEARTRAFLLERFWVLERSVDVDGADFFIQRRITSKNLLDRQPPSLGVVQVKHFASRATHHFVHERYVVGEDGTPYTEFFLLAHTGDIEHARAFLAPGDQICHRFPRVGDEARVGFLITYKQITQAEYEITAPKLALDRIEHQLQVADFLRNRSLIAWALPSASLDLDGIDPLYREDIDNSWGDIPESFATLKGEARSALFTIDKVHNCLRQVIAATDPLAAERLLKEIDDECTHPQGRWSVPLPEALHAREFFHACERHRRMVAELRRAGVLDRFVAVKEEIRAELIACLEADSPLDRDCMQRFIVRYDPASLKLARVESTLERGRSLASAGLREGSLDYLLGGGITASSAGRIECCWFPARYCSLTADSQGSIADLRTRDLRLLGQVMDTMFALKFGQ